MCSRPNIIMKFNPDIHKRRSIRLMDYDYSSIGAYFITVCVKNRQSFFGEIADSQMILHSAGLMIDRWWNKLPGKFQNVQLDKYVVMPNHFHGIIQIRNPTEPAQPNQCEDTYQIEGGYNEEGAHAGAPLHEIRSIADRRGRPACLPSYADTCLPNNPESPLSNYSGVPLHKMIQWFKTMTTNEYIRNERQNGWQSFDRKLWQRNYYEHIIRDNESLNEIREYIVNNPINWIVDDMFPEITDKSLAKITFRRANPKDRANT